ncbi:MAG: tetratricopeptide repeat protein [Terriglobales bacterium]
MLTRLRISAVAALFLFAALLAFPSQAQNTEQLEVGPPPLHRADPPAPGASPEELEQRGDELREDKDYLDAIDFYQAFQRTGQGSAAVFNKIGICQLLLRRHKEARKSFEQAIRVDYRYADAYNNLGVVYYAIGENTHQSGNFNKAIKMYDKAIAFSSRSASFYSNRGAAYFAKKHYELASADYSTAIQLDPDIFERTSRSGVQAMLPSPEERARYEYVVAKLYAKAGITDRSLRYLQKAMEDGYKDISNVYKDNEFSDLRKDPRFTALMATKTLAIPD